MFPLAKILVVDDEANIRSSLERILARDGYQVVAVESGEAALTLIPTERFDLALIDLKMRGVGGIEVLRALRQHSPSTIAIILTAYATLETAIEALRQGAHDYLFKPYNPVELRESVRQGLLKRQSDAQHHDLLSQLNRVASSLDQIRAAVAQPLDKPSPPTPARPPRQQKRFLQRGGLIVDFMRHVITLDGHLLDLTPTEFHLLAYLIKESPKVISPQRLVSEVQGYDSEPWEASETVRQYVYRIRKKIRQATGHRDIVRTVRGVGYTIGA